MESHAPYCNWPETDGVLKKILVGRGDVASAGDVLAVISS